LILNTTDPSFTGVVDGDNELLVYIQQRNPILGSELRFLKGSLFSVFRGFVFAPGFYLIEPFNEKIGQLSAAGLISYWTNLKQDEPLLSDPPPKPLTFDHLGIIFKMWILLVVACLFVFTYEMKEMYSNCCREKQRRISPRL